MNLIKFLLIDLPNELMFYAQLNALLILGMIITSSIALVMMSLILKDKYTK